MDSEAFYVKLKQSLEETTTFPTQYLYKFIVPNESEKIEQIEDVFNHLGAVINTKTSRKGTYTSVSIQVIMQSSDHVIEKYKEAAQVEGIISL